MVWSVASELIAISPVPARTAWTWGVNRQLTWSNVMSATGAAEPFETRSMNATALPVQPLPSKASHPSRCARPRKRSGGLGIEHRDRQLFETRIVDLCLECSRHPEPTQGTLHRRLPRRRGADEDDLSIGDRFADLRAKTRVARAPPQENVRVEDE